MVFFFFFFVLDKVGRLTNFYKVAVQNFSAFIVLIE